MMGVSQPRQPKGTSQGGQFAPGIHTEAAPSLIARPLPSLDSLYDTYPELRQVADVFAAHGHSVYIVGGTMRDLASGDIPKDLDITSPLRPDEFREAVAGLDAAVYDVGEEHGTTGVVFGRVHGQKVTVEHTTHRTEIYETGSRTPTVTMGDDLDADLARRDFTINAVAMDLTTGKIVDPFGGLADLERGVLRTPDDPSRTFREDPLRISRLVRFAGTRDLSIDPATAQGAALMAGNLDFVSAERKRDELIKIFGTGPVGTARALRVSDALGSGVRDRVWGGLGNWMAPQAMERLDCVDTDDVVGALALRSTEPEAALRALRFPNTQIAAAMAVVNAAQELAVVRDPATQRALMRRYGHDACARAARVFNVLPGVTVDDRARVETFLDANAGFATQPRPVDGHDAIELGLRGPRIGAALQAVEIRMCENPSLSRKTAMAMLSANVSS